MSTSIIKGIDKAVSDFNSWNGIARIYFDKGTEEVWTKTYKATNLWEHSLNKDIVEVHNKGINSKAECNNTVTLEDLKSKCDQQM